MRSDESMFRAAIESARIFNHTVREVAETSGLLSALGQPRSVADLVRLMGFRPERGEQVRHMLRALASEGVVRQSEHNRIAVFEADAAKRELLRQRDNGRYREATDAISAWFGEDHVERIRDSNKGLLGRDLAFLRSEHAAIRFSREFEDGWRANLLNPLYEYGRTRCVEYVVAAGARFLDLACGPGFGAIRLAQLSAGPCAITAVDKSADFLDIARRNDYLQSNVTFIQRDLNTGLPPVPAGSVDGVLFNGAFHFVSDKPACLRQIWRALRPGGRLAIGHCFSFSGFPDESMHDFYFSMIDDRTYVLPWLTIKEMLREVGFELADEFHRGSHSYVLAMRPETAPRAPEPTALDSVRPQTRGGAP